MACAGEITPLYMKYHIITQQKCLRRVKTSLNKTQHFVFQRNDIWIHIEPN